MQITIEEATYYAVTDCRILAIQGEANTRSVHFTYPAVSGAEQYFLRVQLPESLIYDLPITVQNGHIYTLPMTGGSGFPFAGVGIVALLVGLLLFANVTYQTILKNLKRRLTHEN